MQTHNWRSRPVVSSSINTLLSVDAESHVNGRGRIGGFDGDNAPAARLGALWSEGEQSCPSEERARLHCRSSMR